MDVGPAGTRLTGCIPLNNMQVAALRSRPDWASTCVATSLTRVRRTTFSRMERSMTSTASPAAQLINKSLHARAHLRFAEQTFELS